MKIAHCISAGVLQSTLITVVVMCSHRDINEVASGSDRRHWCVTDM